MIDERSIIDELNAEVAGSCGKIAEMAGRDC